MGDGNIIMELDGELREGKETPRSSTGKSTPAECSTPKSPSSPPPEIEELHRNTTNSVDTPATISGLSSLSIHSPTSESQPSTDDQITPRRGTRRNFRIGAQALSADNEFGLPLGPAAGLGPQETVAPDGNQAIFSVRGTRSFKIYRHRDNVSVFPSGCMGVTDTVDEGASAEVTVGEETSPAPAVSQSLPSSPSIVLARPNSATRNPLTGEGYSDKDYKTQTGFKKRADGNPVLGQGYDPAKNTRGTRVPPGGHSKGLW